MYSNIGRKIKIVAGIIGYGGMFACIVAGIVYTAILADNYVTEDYAFLGLLCGMAGAVLFWLSQFILYGFGELIDQTTQINQKFTVASSEKNTSEKIAKLREWRTKGLITEEEYNAKIKNL